MTPVTNRYLLLPVPQKRIVIRFMLIKLCDCLVQLLGGFWPPEAEAVSKRPASQAAFRRSASHRSDPPTEPEKRPSVGFFATLGIRR